MGLVPAGDFGEDGLRAHGGDDDIIFFRCQQLGGGLGAGEHPGAAVGGEILHILQVHPQIPLEGGCHRVQNVAADLLILFVEGHIVAPLEQPLHGLHPGGPAADDRRLLLPGGGGQNAFGIFVEAAPHGVDAAELGGVGAGHAEAGAAQAGHMLPFPALGILPGHIIVGMEATVEGHQIRLAGSDDLLGLCGILDGAHHADRQVGIGLLDGLGEAHVDLLLHGVVGHEPAHVIGFAVQVVEAGGNMEDVDLILDIADELDGLLQMHLVGGEFLGADAVLDDEVFSHLGAHRIQHLAGEAGAVFETAAVFVRALVILGAGKLGDEVAVGAVDHADLHARLPAEARAYFPTVSRIFSFVISMVA